MKLEKITKWEEIKEFLNENPIMEYKKLVEYQQNLANTKYKKLSPLSRWNESFKDTINYLKKQTK